MQLTQPAWSYLADEEMGSTRPHIWKTSSNPENQVCVHVHVSKHTCVVAYTHEYTHVWVHVHMWMPVIDIENHLNCSSTLFKEAFFS